ncbi:hypothetical protein DXT90_14380 [Agrobacterium tumefaciens]|nr:hypothetical protein ASE62_09090 [Rhizobium sp. Leaf202]KQN85811.1 hypothetical protein ASF03_09200 [Rhizobium sp. Leaf68]KQR33476.1 hypothetical protein ASF91_05625 [Rhizobium sp. Leaf155]MQB21816.1 hypothetical protein [Agrobacterium tumefaciens]
MGLFPHISFYDANMYKNIDRSAILTYQFSVRFFEIFCVLSQVADFPYNLFDDFTICSAMD